MKIEVFNEELNAKIRGAKLNGERTKEKMLEILKRLHVSQIADSNGGFMDEDTKLLLMMLQIVWNEKEELAEEIKRLNGVMSCMVPDGDTIAGSSLFTD